MLERLSDLFKRTFWRHHWEYPSNGNPYRRYCTICEEHQEWDNGVPYETARSNYYWVVWNEGDHTKHWRTK